VLHNFGSKVDKKLDSDFIQVLSKKFSASTIDQEIVFKATSLNSVKYFYEFIVVAIICGIPEIYLKGSKADWLDILKRLNLLKGHNFDWFVKDTLKIIERISHEFDGDTNDDFWINMFKTRKLEEYGNPETVDGWITKFFPYSKEGNRLAKDYFNTTPFHSVVQNLSPQVVDLDFIHLIKDGIEEVETPLTIKAGFIGIKQDKETMALEPNIGWSIYQREKNLRKLVEGNEHNILSFQRLTAFPKEILEIKEIEFLSLSFEDQIDIDPNIREVDIFFLELFGKTGLKGRRRLLKIFKNTNTEVHVNGRHLKTILGEIKLALKKISPFHKKYFDY